MSLKAVKIIYWISTVLICIAMFFSAIMQILQTNEHFLEEMKVLGYPLTFLMLLGILKILGIVALLVPGLPTIREWAYAGFVFTLFCAAYAHAVIGLVDPPHFLLMAILLVSYFTNRKLQKEKAKAVA